MNINKFTQFLLENKASMNLFYSDKFRTILYNLYKNGSENTKNIANELIFSENSKNIKDEYSLIDISDNNDKITLIQVSRIKREYPDMSVDDILNIKSPDNKFWSKSRIEFKLGKWVQRVFTNVLKTTITNTSVEEFVNSYKADFDKKTNKIQEFFGDDIKKYYLENNYMANTGQLGNSCMRYLKCQNYLDIYTYNPKVCKLLVILNEDGKVKGRALLWTTIDNTKYMDRIYTNYDSDRKIFEEYADKNNYSKYPATDNLKVKISEDDFGVSFDEYPYMDTLISYNRDTGILTNALLDDDEWLILQCTNGQHSGNEGVWSDYLEEYIEEEYAVWCENINSYVHSEAAIWLEYLDEYAYDNGDLVWSDYSDSYFYRKDAVKSEIADDWYYINNSDFIEVQINAEGDMEYVPKDRNDLYIIYEGKYFYKRNYIKDPYTQNYYFLDDILDGEKYKNSLLFKLENDLKTQDKNIIKKQLIDIYKNDNYNKEDVINFIEKDDEFKSKIRIFKPLITSEDIVLILFSQIIDYLDPKYKYNLRSDLLNNLEKFDINEDIRKRYTENGGTMLNYILTTLFYKIDISIFGENVYKRYLYLDIKT